MEKLSNESQTIKNTHGIMNIMSNENLYLYILMRTDLPSQGAGRAAAQASHAANAFIHRYGKNADVKLWQGQTPQGFGTAIVLGATLEQINDAIAKAGPVGGLADKVVDPDYVIPVSSEVVEFLDPKSRLTFVEPSPNDPKKYLLHRSEVTCGYVFGDKEKLKEVLNGLPLYS
jgi:Peptidyl-tRNA hydrolase PTH2